MYNLQNLNYCWCSNAVLKRKTFSYVLIEVMQLFGAASGLGKNFNEQVATLKYMANWLDL